MARIKPKIIKRNYPPIKRPIAMKDIDQGIKIGLEGVELIDSLTDEQRTSMSPNFHFKFEKRTKDKIYIIGGGPSVLQCDLNTLTDGDTMAVNRAIEYVPSPTYFLTMDYTFIRDKVNIKDLDKAKYKIFVLNTVGNMQEHKGVYYDGRFGMVYQKMFLFNKVYKSRYTVAPATGFSLTEENFAHGENSGFCALQTAILMGYKEIVLIGFDLTVTGKTHFHGGYGQNQGAFMKRLNRYLMHYQNAFRVLPIEIKNIIFSGSKRSKLNQYLEYKDVKFLTDEKALIPMQKDFILPPCDTTQASPDIETLPTLIPVEASTVPVSAFEENTLDDLMVVGYYTIDTPYEAEAKKTIASCEKFKLNYDIIGIKNLGNWQANTRYKAQFMIDMLNKHKDKRLLYVDVDAMFHESPELFKNYSCDVAVRWQDFRWRQNECLSGTIYLENNPKTMELCKMWLNTNIQQGSNVKSFEQWNLGAAIENMRKFGLNDKILPPEYCQFDLIEKIYPHLKKGKGVIQHYQASRKFKNKV